MSRADIYNAQEVLAATETSSATTLPSVTYNPKKPDETQAQIIARDQARYEQDYVPVEDKAIGSLDDMSIIDDAQTRVADNGSIARAKQRANRERKRYGFRVNRSQRAAANHGLRMDKAAGDADILNEARLNQFDRNRGFRNELINIGRGVSEQAAQGIGDAAAMQTQRDNANRASKASAKAQQTQMIGSVASMALMAAMMM